MATTTPQHAELPDDQESEWEYEYAEDAEDVHHIVLDLSEGLPYDGLAQVSAALAASHDLGAKAGAPGEAGDGETGAGGEPGDGEGDGEAAEPSQRTEHVVQKGFQVLGLKTPNPIICYDDSFYECTWASAVGTDLVFAQPSPRASEPCLLKDQKFDLVGASRLRLVGRRMDVQPTEEEAPSQISATLPMVDAVHTTAQRETAMTADEAHLAYVIDSSTNASRVAQAQFLQELIQIKRDRGENDQVLVRKA